MIVGAHLVGASAATVANIVGVSKGTVSNVMRAYSMHAQTTSANFHILPHHLYTTTLTAEILTAAGRESST
ncbi:hypothetical protein C0J52_21428 [Blattella germanica]|nr:hypothetical protein C0J52_21428 [Blattella germanica]